MQSENHWIDERLTAAADRTAKAGHSVPSLLVAELKQLLDGPLQIKMSTSELDQLAITLLAKLEGEDASKLS